jgi:hypothetical protein
VSLIHAAIVDACGLETAMIGSESAEIGWIGATEVAQSSVFTRIPPQCDINFVDRLQMVI